MYENSKSLDHETVPVGTNKSGICQNEDENLEFEFQEPADVIFVVEGIKFPCHLKILSRRCAFLRDIVSIHGIQQRLSKKQRIESKHQTHERQQSCSSPSQSITTAVELRNVEHKIFRALLEFLYANELPDVIYWEETRGDSFSSSGEEDAEDPNQSSDESEERSIFHSMRFLQKLLVAADRFRVVALKHEIEYKLYDEFLYSFTSIELFVWADSHSCAFLKEKAMDRIYNKSGIVDDFVVSKDRWAMIRESKRLLEELFLYTKYGAHEIRYVNHNDPASDQKEENELYYYKVEYLRFRLSKLGLDVDGTRKMLEDRLKPYLDADHRHFLPTKLTKLSEKYTGLCCLLLVDHCEKACFSRLSSCE